MKLKTDLGFFSVSTMLIIPIIAQLSVIRGTKSRIRIYRVLLAIIGRIGFLEVHLSSFLDTCFYVLEIENIADK
jgi:hypothetical protein